MITAGKAVPNAEGVSSITNGVGSWTRVKSSALFTSSLRTSMKDVFGINADEVVVVQKVGAIDAARRRTLGIADTETKTAVLADPQILATRTMRSPHAIQTIVRAHAQGPVQGLGIDDGVVVVLHPGQETLLCPHNT